MSFLNATVIRIRVDEAALNECLSMLLLAAGEPNEVIGTLDERFDNLLRLNRIVSERYGFVAVQPNEDWVTADLARGARLVPVASDRLRDYCAALQARHVDGAVEGVKGIGHGEDVNTPC